jgi:hypothetical protein
MEKKIYCGSGKKKSETWLQVTLNPEKFNEHIQEFNGNKFIKLNINVLPQPDKYGKTLSVSIDNWKPDGSKQAESKTQSYASNNQQVNSKPDFDDLPF